MGEPGGLSSDQLRALDRLSGGVALRGFYLAGGTAIASHLHHRRSLDLDFFSVGSFADFDVVKTEVRVAFDEVTVVGESTVAIRLLCDQVPIDFVQYPYPTIEPLGKGPAGVGLASLLDLATMKLAAISKRGLRRDFWDLFAIGRNGIALQQSGAAYVRRFGVAEADLYHVLRALTYFDDAEKDPVLTAGLDDATWAEIKAFFRHEAPQLVGASPRR